MNIEINLEEIRNIIKKNNPKEFEKLEKKAKKESEILKKLETKKMKYYENALNLSKQGKDPFKQLQLSARTQLLIYKKSEVVKKVDILNSGVSCTSCKKNYNKFYTIEEALKKMPIPNKNCSYHLFPRKNKKYSFCRCIYLPITGYE